ncbi:MAG: NAD(P)-dependent oxidoreductase [Candidatus Bathyarchaeota archaeon]|nr:NAD(P)-dependent oxidoreductase [Candidatus Bathyarchaeota archaeon]
MTVLVTGGAGRLGYEVAKLLAANGYKVKAFDLPNVEWSHLETIQGVEPFKGDLTDPTSLKKASRDAEAVVHLAALLPPRSEMNRSLTLKVNVDGTRNLIDAINSETHVVFASSISTYGITSEEEPPIKEQHPQKAHNNYSESKIMAEKAIKQSGNPYTSLRVAPVSVADLLELPDTVAYKTDQRVEFIYVEDAAQAILACLKEAKPTVYNIGGGESWQMNGEEYLNRFYGALGVEVEPNYPEEYTAVDWYDTSRSRHLGYQRTSFNQFEQKLVIVGEELGLR